MERYFKIVARPDALAGFIELGNGVHVALNLQTHKDMGLVRPQSTIN